MEWQRVQVELHAQVLIIQTGAVLLAEADALPHSCCVPVAWQHGRPSVEREEAEGPCSSAAGLKQS